MNEKEYRDLATYKQVLDAKGEQRPVTVYEKYFKRVKVKKEEKEPKSAIWWMIMIFCIVYGFELLYTAMITSPVAP